MSNLNTQRPYFPNLDILRFFAACMVLLGHSLTDGLKYLNFPFPIKQLLSLITYGKHWVSLFFVLSGFLLSYLAFKNKINSNFKLKNFLIRRALRIWPLYFLFVAIGYLFIPLISNLFFDKNLSYSSLTYFIFFIGNFAMTKMYELGDLSLIPGNTSILWSISIEEQFCIILALAFISLNIKQLKLLIQTFITIGLIYILITPTLHSAFTFHTLFYVFDFFIGCMLGYYAIQHKNWIDTLNNKAKTLEWILLIGFVGILFISNFQILKITLVLWFTLLIFYSAFVKTKFTEKLKTYKWLIYGGKISYGIYVIHPVFQYLFHKIFNHLFSSSNQFGKDFLVFVTTFIFTIITAHLSYQYFEKYFLKLKDKFY